MFLLTCHVNKLIPIKVLLFRAETSPDWQIDQHRERSSHGKRLQVRCGASDLSVPLWILFNSHTHTTPCSNHFLLLASQSLLPTTPARSTPPATLQTHLTLLTADSASSSFPPSPPSLSTVSAFSSWILIYFWFWRPTKEISKRTTTC